MDKSKVIEKEDDEVLESGCTVKDIRNICDSYKGKCGVMVKFYDNDGFKVTFNIMNHVSRNMFSNAIKKEALITWLDAMCEAVSASYNEEEDDED